MFHGSLRLSSQNLRCNFGSHEGTCGHEGGFYSLRAWDLEMVQRSAGCELHVTFPLRMGSIDWEFKVKV